MKDGIATFEMIAEVQLLAERAFVFKLKEKNPNITPDEVEAEVAKWYKDRPGAEFGDAVGRIGDPRRFNKD
jgi:hypothetical protein